MRPKDEMDAKLKTGTFILSEKIDDTKSKRSEKDLKKEMKRLEKERIEREKREKKIREKLKEKENQPKKGKVVCGGCGGKCSGEVLRVSEQYFHAACFTCRSCAASLAKGGFFAKDGHYYCPQDYQRSFGTRCAACQQYVEGEVVAALGRTYHQKCFLCARCRRAFPSGEKVTYTGTEVICSACVGGSPRRAVARQPENQVHVSKSQAEVRTNGDVTTNGDKQNECAGCGQELLEGQALVALERQWHPSCFACGSCGVVLQGEYMGRAGTPYCERDYQRLFGVRCAYCQRYIAGKVLQAGENHHFHPTCARCSKCGDPFGDGEEMFLQGAAVWHPRCGPAPGQDCSRTASATDQFSLRSRTPSVSSSFCSPYGSLGRQDDTEQRSPLAVFSYLGGAGSLRRPLPPQHPPREHFHTPPPNTHGCSSRASTRASSRCGRPAMEALVDALRSETPRPKSPHLDNEEPIELSHYPAAYKPPPGTKPKIERDDFPAPPYPYTDPERRRRWSDSYKGMTESDEDSPTSPSSSHAKERLRKEEHELAKIQTGIAQVFLKEVKEREKLQQWKKQNLDPRSASRTASASRESCARLRYPSPLGASPSRDLHTHSAASNHGHTGHSHTHGNSTTIPHGAYNGHSFAIPGRSSTLPAGMRAPHTNGDFTFGSALGDHTHSTDFSSGKSDISAGSITDVDRSAVSGVHRLGAGVGVGAGVGGMRGIGGVGGSRRSLPSLSLLAPAKLYPYHLLLITNYRLPPDVDRLNLERHLSDAEFEAILQVTRSDFYRLPQWRRNELKRRARLF